MATAPAKKAPATKRRKRKGKNLLSGFDASVEEQSALDQYLRDVSRHELITPDREKEPRVVSLVKSPASSTAPVATFSAL